MTVSRHGRESEGAALLRERFAEMEQRVRKIVSDNRELRTRVQELEQELDQAEQGLRELGGLRGKHAEIRERLTGILAKLESLEKGNGPGEHCSPEEHQR